MSLPAEGRRLRAILDERRLAPSEALRLAARLCDALEVLHAQGLVHGNLGPETVVCLPGDGVQLVDAGRPAPDPSPGRAPELRAGAAPDARSDLFSLGVLLYELLTRRFPTDPFEPPSGVAGTSLALDQVLRKALDPDPSKRPAGLRAIRDVVSPPPPRPPPSEWSTMKIPWIAAGVMCLFVLVSMGLAGWRIKMGRRAARLGTLEADPPPLLHVAADGTLSGTAARSIADHVATLARDSVADVDLDPGAPPRIQKELADTAEARGITLRFVAGDARVVRLRLAPAQKIRVEDYELRLGAAGEMLTVVDRKGVRCVDFLRLRKDDLRRWFDLELSIVDASPDGVTVQARIVPGGIPFGAGNYLSFRAGLRVELPRGRRFTVESYDPATLDLRATFEGDGASAERTLAPQSEMRLLGISCRYRPDPADASQGLILTED